MHRVIGGISLALHECKCSRVLIRKGVLCSSRLSHAMADASGRDRRVHVRKTKASAGRHIHGQVLMLLLLLWYLLNGGSVHGRGGDVRQRRRRSHVVGARGIITLTGAAIAKEDMSPLLWLALAIRIPRGTHHSQALLRCSRLVRPVPLVASVQELVAASALPPPSPGASVQ